MAKRGGEAALKRAREKVRLEKREAKREKRQARATDTPNPEINVEKLMEEFANLNDRNESGQITTARFKEERHRILVALGIELEDD